jgi:hypothetical protein
MDVVDVVFGIPFVNNCVVSPIVLYIFPKPFLFPYVFHKTLLIFGFWEPIQRIMEIKPDPMISIIFYYMCMLNLFTTGIKLW